MGFFPCDICGERLTMDLHVCDPEKIKERIRKLEERAGTAEARLDEVRNSVYRLLEPLTPFQGEEVMVKTEWLRRLWDAADCNWNRADTADTFLVRWVAVHLVLSKAFNVFRSGRDGKTRTLLEKLETLREACDQAKKTLGYESSKLDLSPEEVVGG